MPLKGSRLPKLPPVTVRIVVTPIGPVALDKPMQLQIAITLGKGIMCMGNPPQYEFLSLNKIVMEPLEGVNWEIPYYPATQPLPLKWNEGLDTEVWVGSFAIRQMARVSALPKSGILLVKGQFYIHAFTSVGFYQPAIMPFSAKIKCV